jgi:hypothetical protein
VLVVVVRPAQRKAVVEDARHAWNAAKLLDRGQLQTDKMRANVIGDALLRHAAIVLVQETCPISVMLHDLRNVADAEAWLARYARPGHRRCV